MDRVIPKKNYIILGVIIVVTFVLIYCLYMWYDAYLESKLNKPILNKYMEVINYNELDDYLVESSKAIIYISKLEDSNIREFEKKFKNLFKNDLIDRKILYLDITREENVLNEITNKYSDGVVNDKSIPIILVVENGNIKSYFEIKENNYDIDLVKEFILGIKFSEEDELDG